MQCKKLEVENERIEMKHEKKIVKQVLHVKNRMVY